MKKSAPLLRIVTLFLIVSVLCLSSQAQEKISRTLSWKYIPASKVTPGTENSFPWFDGAIALDETDMPYYVERFKMPEAALNASVELYDEVYEAISTKELNEIPATVVFPEQASSEANVVIERKQYFALVQVFPFRKDPATGRIEKLVSFSLKVWTSGMVDRDKSWNFTNHSVLSSGSWFKITLQTTGIYKLTYADLVAMGAPVATTDPRNVGVYGQGGKALPENNATFRYDDLQENAIYVYGEEDGVFNEGDYILFYGDGIASWTYDTAYKKFQHYVNKFSSTAYYFLKFGDSPGKRISLQASDPGPATYAVNTYQGYLFHERDSLNLIKSGREWYGEVFDIKTQYDYVFQIPNPVAGSKIKFKSSLLARSFVTGSYFDVYLNGVKVNTYAMYSVPISYTSLFASQRDDTVSVAASSSLSVSIIFHKASADNMGWLNYLNVNHLSYLSFSGGQLAFRNGYSIGKGISAFTVSNGASATVWNVTDPLNIKRVTGDISGSDLVFRLETDSLLEFVAHDGNSYLSPISATRMANQDLHGLGAYDMVILTHPDFLGQAERLAQHHRDHDGLEVVVVMPEQVYNEFSSGKQDPTAVKSMMKMFYDRSTGPETLPSYLLLFGDGSYDLFQRLPDNTNFILTWQSPNSLLPTSSYLTDDYFGFLDDAESGGFGGNIDIGIGRLPVKSVDEAVAAVDKIIYYSSSSELVMGSQGCSGVESVISNLGDWRNVLCFVADDADKSGENFLNESEAIARKIDTLYPVYNIDKIYLDAYVQESTPGGQRYPDANLAILQRVEKGALIMNYIGHGGEVGWAHETILGVSEINSFTNKYNLPLFVTATCEFSRFDDPARTSAGEYVFINPNGGGIALFTTTRLAFSGSNSELNLRFYNYVLAKNGGIYPAIGEVVRNAKNSYGCSEVIANFCLLGDPAMKLAYPKYNVVTTLLNGQVLGGDADTIRAMAKVTVAGEIRDDGGTTLTDFNGMLFPLILDKMMKYTSRGNDAGYPTNFYLQKNIVYKGKASVTNGTFGFSFMVPKDIAYHYGNGKFSFYAKSAQADATGYYNEFIIGGTEDFEQTDKEGPGIELYMNDENFVSGGITDPDPILFAKMVDTSGMNTVGSGIGHDIAAVLDGNTDKTVVLNDYYEADLNTYQSGTVRYPFSDLDEGSHTLNLKAWDIFNNSSEHTIDFVVAENAELALDHVLNYPNPFTTYTEFWFEHNRPCCGLEVQIQIFTITGKLIKTLQTWVQTNGYRADPIPWDGLDEYGDPIGKGVYLYKLQVRDSQGSSAETIEKLVILR